MGVISPSLLPFPVANKNSLTSQRISQLPVSRCVQRRLHKRCRHDAALQDMYNALSDVAGFENSFRYNLGMLVVGMVLGIISACSGHAPFRSVLGIVLGML